MDHNPLNTKPRLLHTSAYTRDRMHKTCKCQSGKIFFLDEMLGVTELPKCIIELNKTRKFNISKRDIFEKLIDLNIISVKEEQYFSDMKLLQKGIDLNGAFYTVENHKFTDLHLPLNVYIDLILENTVTFDRLKDSVKQIRRRPEHYKLRNGFPLKKTKTYSSNHTITFKYNKNVDKNKCICENGKIMDLDDMLSISEYTYLIKDAEIGKVNSERQLYFLLRSKGYIECNIEKSNYSNIKFTKSGSKENGAMYLERKGFYTKIHFPIEFYNKLNNTNLNPDNIRKILKNTGQYNQDTNPDADIRNHI